MSVCAILQEHYERGIAMNEKIKYKVYILRGLLEDNSLELYEVSDWQYRIDQNGFNWYLKEQEAEFVGGTDAITVMCRCGNSFRKDGAIVLSIWHGQRYRLAVPR